MTKKQTKTKGATKGSKATKAAAAAKAPKAPRERARDPRLPAAGTTIVRAFKGKDHRVTVLDAGFRYEGKEYRSLTALALEITGYPAISGPAFFGLTGPKPVATETPAKAPKWKRPAKVAAAPKEEALANAAPDAASV